ncbi:zinc finger protein 777-like isoform X2 [Numida meleagris]|uniref:zinc finger protein 777-like isoform X2 n=1 Tax=Numida meleagris TaxID=8996 RepID=UPI000B3DF853|nr:zinc finger protein 777-like isoform X2 [Numida meleagris]
MEELHARIEALERRLERAEAALRDREAWGLRLPSFSREEWALLDDEQKELHESVMQSNYEMLASLCCDLARPGVLLQMERGEPGMPAEPDWEGTAVSLKPAAELDCPGSVSGEALLQVEAKQTPEGRCGSLEDSGSPADAPDSTAPHVPQETIGAPADLSHAAASPPCPISTCCQEALTLSLPPSPPPAAGAEVRIPEEVLQEGIGIEEGLQKEDLKDAGSSGQDLAADAPEEPGREEMPDLCQTAAHVDPSSSADLLGKPVRSAGRTAACQRNSSREKFYRCVVCGKNFLLKINLIIHQRSHSNWVPYVCIECDQAFMSKKKIRRHLRIRAATGFCPPSDTKGCSSLVPCAAAQPHDQGSGSGEQWEKPSPNRFPLSPQKIMYTCTECMENFSSQNFLVLHQRTHADQHHFTLCPCCNRSFAWASEFVRHRQSDAGRKAYWCGECQKAYKRHDRPRGHQKTDVRRESPYECSSKLPLQIAPVLSMDV